MKNDCKCEIEREKEFWRMKSIKQSEYIEKFFLDRENKIYENIDDIIRKNFLIFMNDEAGNIGVRDMIHNIRLDISELKENKEK